MTTDDIQAIFADHVNSSEARLARHEQRMAEIDAGLAQRIDACLAQLDLELDALADQGGGGGISDDKANTRETGTQKTIVNPVEWIVPRTRGKL